MGKLHQVLLCAAALIGTACAEGVQPGGAGPLTFGTTAPGPGGDGDDGDDDGGSDGGVPEDAICLAQNCEEDLHCAGCDEGRNTCLVEERRCVACDPNTGEGCDEGEECTEYGYCVPEGQTCETDAQGVPTVVCAQDADCAACDPNHQTCDTALSRCVACTADDDSQCLGNQHCEDGECVADCPQSCTSDAECGACGEEGHEAHACNHHRCAECNDNIPCPSGQVCNEHGACVEICGIPGQQAGTCENDSDCAGCAGDATHCVVPLNGGHGECGPEASGCSDLGEGVVVLPEPYDQITNACSDDDDCNGVGIQYNVGKLLRELTGIDSIDDANIDYPMNSCAAVTVGAGGTSLSCGICVPCKTDNDCQDIDIDQVAGEAFGPLGAIASAILLDQLFGAESHDIHMFCQPVGAGYGACVPCPTLVSDCTAAGGGGGGGEEASCDHDACTEGGPLKPTCGACASDVCAADDYCCTVEWDDICVEEVEEFCTAGCGGGGGGSSCEHDQCTEGSALSSTCNSCTSAVCAEDPYCCQTAWDDICVGLVATECGGDCGGGGCAHSECDQGGPLPSSCSSCAASVCAQDDFCCAIDWDDICVGIAGDLCTECAGGGGGSSCGHDVCVEGAPLEDGCEDCVSDVCFDDDFCCTTGWDMYCVDAAEFYCGVTCG